MKKEQTHGHTDRKAGVRWAMRTLVEVTQNFSMFLPTAQWGGAWPGLVGGVCMSVGEHT